RALLAVPAVVGRHDRAHAGLDGRDVALEVEPLQLGLVEPGVAAVEREALLALAAAGAERRAAVARVVLRAGQHPKRVLQVRALEPADRGPAELGPEPRVLGEALVGAAPARVPGHGHAGGERPVDAGGPDFLGRHPRDLLDERLVPRGPEPDVVG